MCALMHTFTTKCELQQRIANIIDAMTDEFIPDQVDELRELCDVYSIHIYDAKSVARLANQFAPPHTEFDSLILHYCYLPRLDKSVLAESEINWCKSFLRELHDSTLTRPNCFGDTIYHRMIVLLHEIDLDRFMRLRHQLLARCLLQNYITSAKEIARRGKCRIPVRIRTILIGRAIDSNCVRDVCKLHSVRKVNGPVPDAPLTLDYLYELLVRIIS